MLRRVISFGLLLLQTAPTRLLHSARLRICNAESENPFLFMFSYILDFSSALFGAARPSIFIATRLLEHMAAYLAMALTILDTL